MKTTGRDKKTCATKCVQLVAEYVLYDADRKTLEDLDDQHEAEAFAGQRVHVLGTRTKGQDQGASIEAVGGQSPVRP